MHPRDRSFDPGNPVNIEEAALVVQGGSENGRIVAVSSHAFALGREPDNDLVLDEPVVSRRHAVIVRKDMGYYLRDLQSTNGTFLNRTRISEGDHSLKQGDIIRLGGSSVTFLFRHSGARTLKVSVVEPAPVAVVVDARARQVFVRGQRIDPPLARKEFDLLMLLDSRRGEAISRDEIAREVWPERSDGDVGNHEIEQCVHRVRAHIEEDTSAPKYLITMRGFGYKLE